MEKFLAYFRKIVFVWGVISFPFALFALFWIISFTIPRIVSHKVVQQDQDVRYEKTFNDIRLSVVRKYDQTNNFLVSVSRADKPLISDYNLPTKQYDVEWLTIKDASVIPVNDSEYRIILYSAVYDCDQESANYIWLLKLNKQMKLVQMIEMSDVHRIENGGTQIFGNKIISLPSFADLGYKQVLVPVAITIGDAIKTVPMLNRKSMDMMKKYFEKEMQKRNNKLVGSSDTATLELCKKAAKEFDEAISERVIPY
jgi:hypothetical protein